MRAIVTFANGNGNYRRAMDRLEKSLRFRFNGKFFGFTNEAEIGAPPHKENPYAFKIYAIKVARMAGYTSILYLDSSAYAVANVNPIFEIMESDGYFMQAAGHYVGTWSNDYTLNYFHVPREKADTMPMYSAGFTGLDFTKDWSKSFFASWEQSMLNGCFRGDWSNHRHDMTAASIIANQLGFKFQDGDKYIQYGAPDDSLINETIVLKCQGI